MINSPGRVTVKLQAWEGSGCLELIPTRLWWELGWSSFIHSFIKKKKKKPICFLSTKCKALAGSSQSKECW